MASPVLDYGSFSVAQLQAMLTAAQAEYLLRITTGRVRTGSSAAQSYGMDLMTLDDLVRLINGLTAELGLSDVNTTVSPNFGRNGDVIPAESTFGAGPP